jgi:hypothetical protein
MFDAFPTNSRVVILDSDINFFNPRTDDMSGTSAFRMISVQTGFERGKKNAPIQFLANTLALQQSEFGMIAFT